MHSSDEMFQRSQDGHFGVYRHQNNTRVSAEAVRHKSAYIILFPTRHNPPKNDDKNDIIHRPRASLAGFTFYW